jgi:uncharacterized protein YecT (DUF1311 family)
MFKIISLVIILFSTASTAAIDSIDQYVNDGFQASFIDIYDPGYIRIQLDSGEFFDTTYSGIDFDTLFKWNDQAVKRKFWISYTSDKGVWVTDLKTKKKFELDGVIENHPIDIALGRCYADDGGYTTFGMDFCQSMASEAWDAELNRAYKRLIRTNPQNEKLKIAHRKWIQYRDAVTEFYREEYSKREGTKWTGVYIRKILELNRQQTENLQSIKIW